MKKLKILSIIVFCVMLFGGAVITAVLPKKAYSDLENRNLEQKPQLTKEQFLQGKYQEKYEAYLSDQFFLRDRWVDLAVTLQKQMGKRDINNVYLGKEGYLLEKDDENEYDKEQVEENVKTLSSFLNDMCEMFGEKQVSCLMIPSKTLALSKYLPAYSQVSEHTEVLDALQKSLSHPERMIYLKDAMQSHQNEYIYYRTDHHWTTLGAYYAYKEWAEKSGQAATKPITEYTQEMVFDDFYGTTYNKVHVNVPKDQVTLFKNASQEAVHVNMDDGDVEADTLYFPKEAKEGFNRYNVFLSKNTFQIEITTKAKTGKTLLLIKDSFANCFVPFLTENYDRIILIDYRYGKLPIGQILDKYEDITDVLVMFNTEKFMQNTKLAGLANSEKKKQTLEEFNPDDFLE